MGKVLFIILDGLSDRPIKQLGNKTPLEAAKKPNLNKLASRGMTGIMHTVDFGIRPGSDVAHLSLFGYDLARHYPGRGPFEAAGYEMDLKTGDIAFRSNFATVDKQFKVLNRRADRINDTKDLIKSLNGMIIDGVKIFVKQGIGHRAAVIFRGKNLSSKISDVDPHKENVKIHLSRALNKDNKAKRTAQIVNKFTKKSYEILSGHDLNHQRQKEGKPPANILLLRGAGMLPKLPSFYKKYGFRACCIAGAGLYKGIAKLLGMKIILPPNATGREDTDVSAKIKTALTALKHFNFVFVHVKATDILGEDGNYQGKKKFIEKVDKALLPLVKRDDILIVITADHTTSSKLKIHTADPVPLLIVGSDHYIDEVSDFNERTVLKGRLGRITGKHLMPIILDCLGKAPLVGA